MEILFEDTLKYVAKELERGSSVEQIANDLCSGDTEPETIVSIIEELVVVAKKLHMAIS